MYRYDEYDQSIVDARVEEFRDQVERRLSGALTEDQFKPLRLMNGLYLQLHAYMLRVAVPYGTLDSRQMRMLGHIARKYDRGYGHFTTRQNIQYNWIKLADAPDILAELATVQMHATQTSGNCIRNISSDQFAGAAADEVADPRPWAELLRQWSTFHPEFTYLPRKFKIAVIASDDDRAAMREMFRLLKPGGVALLSVPINPTRPTYENPAITGKAERRAHFSAHDHLRYYGTDFADRLSGVGFAVETFRMPQEQEVRYGLLRDEWIYIARKPGGEG